MFGAFMFAQPMFAAGNGLAYGFVSEVLFDKPGTTTVEIESPPTVSARMVKQKTYYEGYVL